MPATWNIQEHDDPRDVIHRVVEAIVQGQLVAVTLHDRTLVIGSLLNDGAVGRLVGSGEPSGSEWSLLFASGETAIDLLPEAPLPVRRMLRRVWPGPLVVEADVAVMSLASRWRTPALLKGIEKSGHIVMRVPASDVMFDIQSLIPGPLVAREYAGRGIEQFPVDVRASVAVVLEGVDLRIGGDDTRIAISPSGWKMVREGCLSGRMLNRLAAEVFLFVCTGNTCRSPMAEVLFRKKLSELARCAAEEIEDYGYHVASAGISAVEGAAASEEAVKLLSREGVDLRSHSSQSLTNDLLNLADHILTMTSGHRQAILEVRPDLADRVELLARDASSISDPIGGTLEDYRRCKEEIERHLDAVLSRLVSMK